MFEKLLVGPASEPVTVEEQCTFSHIDVPGLDDGNSPPGPNAERVLIESYITASREQIEQLTKRAMINQRWLQTFDYFPGAEDRFLLGYLDRVVPALLYYPNTSYRFPQEDSIDLLRRPVQPEIEEDNQSPPSGDLVVKYLDLTGAEQVMDPSLYMVYADRITLKPDQLWPISAILRDAVRIEYLCGYGTTADAVPSQLKLAVKWLAGHWYENRVPVGTEATKEVIWTLSSILGSFKLFRVPR